METRVTGTYSFTKMFAYKRVAWVGHLFPTGIHVSVGSAGIFDVPETILMEDESIFSRNFQSI